MSHRRQRPSRSEITVRSPYRKSLGAPVAAIGLIALGALAVAPAVLPAKGEDKPKLTLKASPTIGFAPIRVVLTGLLTGGRNDYEELYCATVEWDWGDGTRSVSSYDCEPYEPGKSEIKRRFATEHRYRVSGNYQIHLRLMRKDDAVAVAHTVVRVRPGLGEGGDR
jgi:hypothetical protein